MHTPRMMRLRINNVMDSAVWLLRARPCTGRVGVPCCLARRTKLDAGSSMLVTADVPHADDPRMWFSVSPTLASQFMFAGKCCASSSSESMCLDLPPVVHLGLTASDFGCAGIRIVVARRPASWSWGCNVCPQRIALWDAYTLRMH